MISVKEAQKRLMQIVRPLGKETVGLDKALGSILAENVRSKIDLPSADNSAVDGFAIRFADIMSSLEIRGVIKAGDLKNPKLDRRQTFRIMTGARIPKGADTVIPKECAIVRGDRLLIEGQFPKGANVRYCGEELRKRSLVLKSGIVIHPGVVGTLATVGRKRVKVFRKPTVSLIVTGSELIGVGRKLKSGQVYDSNSWSIVSALKWMGIDSVRIARVRDSERHLRKIVSMYLKNSDVVLLTGGVSVGDYDFVKIILKELGARTLFWKVSQKPGKPIYAGKKGKALIFGLPGNPASAFTCFYEYVYPVLRKMMGSTDPFLRRVSGRLNQDFLPDQKRLLFLKGLVHFKNSRVLMNISKRQGSHMLTSFSDANGLILVPPGRTKLRKGDSVEADLLPLTGGDVP